MWLGEFTYLGESEYVPLAVRSTFRQQEKTLRNDLSEHKRLSSPVHILGEPVLGANQSVAQPTPRVHVLINEGCASACDIFAAAMQDNKLATIIGRRSMGAGGNVIHGGDSPHEKFSLSQTASLMYRQDGSFIENNGVTPDIALDTNIDEAVWAAIIKSIEGQPPETAGANADSDAL